MTFRNIYTPPFIRAWALLIREKGVKQFVREKGWKIVAAVFLFYLIRDTLLYIVIPVLIAKGILTR